MAWKALSRVARQRMVGSAITTTTSESRTDWYNETSTERSGLNCCVVLRCFVLSGSFASRQWQLPWTRRGVYRQTPHRTHTRALFLVAHACARQMWVHVWLKGLTICSCFKSQFISGHVSVEISLDPISSYFLINYCLTDATDWNQIILLCISVVGWTVWPTGRSDPRHRLWAQVLHRCQQRAHADQPSDHKHEFSARVRRFRGPSFTSTCRSIKQQPAHGSKQSSHFVDTKFIWGLASRKFRWTTILLQVGQASRRLVRTWIVKQLFQVFSCVCLKGEERSRPKRCANIVRDAKSPEHPWTESWLGCARRKNGSAKIIRSWGRRGGQTLGKEKILLFVRSIRSSKTNNYSNNRRINGLIRLKETRKSLFGELEKRRRLFRENHAKDCQAIEELRRVCCEETDRARQAWIDASKEGSYYCESTIESNSGFCRTRWIPCQMQENFTILRQRAALEHPAFPVNPFFSSLSPRTMPCCDSGLPHDTRNAMGSSGKFLDDFLLEKDELLLSWTIQRIWHPLLKNWDLILKEVQRGRRVNWDENHRIRQYLYHTSKVEVDC